MALEQPKKITGGAFGRYMAENRSALLKECAGKPATATIKLGSERFKALPAPEQQKYQKLYEQAKAKYEKDLAAFKASGGVMAERKSKKSKGGKNDSDEEEEGGEGKTKKRKKKKDANAPKKPAGGAFGCWMAANRAAFIKECAGKPITEVSKIGGVRWKALSGSERKPFEEEYVKKLAAYKEAMKNYTPTAGDGDDASEGTPKKKKKTKDVNAPKRPAGGAFGCWMAVNRAALIKECAGKPITEVSKVGGARWKALSASEKKPFEEAYVKKLAAYKEAMKNYKPAADDDDGDDAEEDEEEEDEEEEPPTKKPAGAGQDEEEDSEDEAPLGKKPAGR